MLGLTSHFALFHKDFPLLSTFVHQKDLGLWALRHSPSSAEFICIAPHVAGPPTDSICIAPHVAGPPTDSNKYLLNKRTEETCTSLLQTGASASVLF